MKTLLLILLFAITFSISYSQVTRLDVTFGNNGIVNTYIGAAGSLIYSMATQTDGKIVVAGNSNDGNITEFAIARYNPDGTPDNDFDVDGKLTTFFGSQAEAISVAIQTDGKIVAGGYWFTDSTWEFAIARYHTDGTLDSSFGEDGMVVTPIGSNCDLIAALCIQGDGKIIATGVSNSAADINNFIPAIALVRYNIDGSLDNTFNGNGKVITNLGIFDIAFCVAIQPDGKIVVGGTHFDTGHYEFILLRYNTNGTPDNSFNGDGKVLAVIGPIYDVIHTIIIQDDGKIVVAGTTGTGVNFDNYDIAVLRYNPDGSIDSTFSEDGKLSSIVSSYFDIAPRVALDNGKIVVAATISDGSARSLVISRFNSDGTTDNSFNGNGKFVTSISGNAIIYAMKIFGSRVYVAGATDQFIIAAYQTISTLPVKLVSFTGAFRNNTAKLQWQTTGESASMYNIERSYDGRNFIKIGEQLSLLNGSTQKNYLFTDAHPLQATNFYRLKMIDKDGSFAYSNIVLIKTNISTVAMQIFPNPVSNFLLLQIPSSQKETITIQISDASGKIIKREVILSAGTPVSASLDVTSLQRNTYFLKVKSNGKIQVKKFVKQ